MANIQSVRYNVPQQAAPGFLDYAAQFLTNFMGRKQEQEEKKRTYEQELFKSMASALASQGQIEYDPVTGTMIGGSKVPWRVRSGEDTSGLPVNVPVMGPEGAERVVQMRAKNLADLNTANRQWSARDLQSYEQDEALMAELEGRVPDLEKARQRWLGALSAKFGKLPYSQIPGQQVAAPAPSTEKEVFISHWKELTPAQKTKLMRAPGFEQRLKDLGIFKNEL